MIYIYVNNLKIFFKSLKRILVKKNNKYLIGLPQSMT